jgi:hypothetical protein
MEEESAVRREQDRIIHDFELSTGKSGSSAETEKPAVQWLDKGLVGEEPGTTTDKEEFKSLHRSFTKTEGTAFIKDDSRDPKRSGTQ